MKERGLSYTAEATYEDMYWKHDEDDDDDDEDLTPPPHSQAVLTFITLFYTLLQLISEAARRFRMSALLESLPCESCHNIELGEKRNKESVILNLLKHPNRFYWGLSRENREPIEENFPDWRTLHIWRIFTKWHGLKGCIHVKTFADHEMRGGEDFDIFPK